jgi:hypothetical protein
VGPRVEVRVVGGGISGGTPVTSGFRRLGAVRLAACGGEVRRRAGGGWGRRGRSRGWRGRRRAAEESGNEDDGEEADTQEKRPAHVHVRGPK